MLYNSSIVSRLARVYPMFQIMRIIITVLFYSALQFTAMEILFTG